MLLLSQKQRQMKTEVVKLSQIKANAANPRQIRDDKFEKLVNSILVFPKMLEIRPIVVDNTFVSLGGNMRYRVLVFIADMSIGDIVKRLSDSRDYNKKTEAERGNLLEYWEKWLNKPTAHIIKASELSEHEQREFIIKDNSSFGQWDYDMLANEWDAEDLDDWGIDVWQNNDESDENLPEELRGVDLTPNDLAKLKGDDKTLMNRIIITFPPDKQTELETMLGVKINKVVFNMNELQPQ